MRIVSWMQQKFSGKQISSKKSMVADSCLTNYEDKKENESKTSPSNRIYLQEWQSGLLTIGTFGDSVNNNIKEDSGIQDNPSSAIQDLNEFSMDEIGKLKNELTKYLALKNSIRDSQSKGSSRRSDCPLNKFLNCPSSLDIDRTSSLRISRDSVSEISENGGPENYHVVASKGKAIVCSADDAGTRIKQKSLKFLLKSIISCRGGFVPAPSLRETQLIDSRADKMIRSILHRKIYHNQNVVSRKNTSQRISMGKGDSEDESNAKEIDKCKWVKTDSECKPFFCCSSFLEIEANLVNATSINMECQIDKGILPNNSTLSISTPTGKKPSVLFKILQQLETSRFLPNGRKKLLSWSCKCV